MDLLEEVTAWAKQAGSGLKARGGDPGFLERGPAGDKGDVCGQVCHKEADEHPRPASDPTV